MRVHKSCYVFLALRCLMCSVQDWFVDWLSLVSSRAPVCSATLLPAVCCQCSARRCRCCCATLAMAGRELCCIALFVRHAIVCYGFALFSCLLHVHLYHCTQVALQH